VRTIRLPVVLLLLSTMAWAAHNKIQRETLADYIRRNDSQVLDLRPATTGSIWNDSGRLAYLSTDYKAMRVGDLITILVVQDVKASNAGNVATDRSLKASSGIDALAGHISTSGVQSILSLTSSQSLAGKAQATSDSSLRTSLAGRVAGVLTNGVMVVEAEREITMNNERQTILLRGLVRPGDVTPDNVVASNAIGNLELELKGKGVISDGTRPPNPLVRWLLRVVGF
jgi:flagellar L-ring protein FlgH